MAPAWPARIGHRALALVALALASAAGLLLAPAARADNPSCSDLTIIFARGSDQDFDKSDQQGRFFQAVRKHTPKGITIGEIRLGAFPIAVKEGGKTSASDRPGQKCVTTRSFKPR